MVNRHQETYSVLRCGGATPARACAETGVRSGRGSWLEAGFQAGLGVADGRAIRPRFAGHAEHVAAVQAAGGYPVLVR
ncbi:MAG: hypothetical protein JNK30_14900 [Phenylobacterium sp.]|uniref:hypothetical protein n=1 Tax=Phenylobacterium sp. TaxID=1871053 RepID=UPI001A3872B8|nr:hypothetical protein [Phenylobacterium sp.]MBL8772669.1 hypothetical protein [Phenylobacterium sp.]